MAYKSLYVDGKKQWQPLSKYAQEDPYMTFRRQMGHPPLDVDERLVGVRDGKLRTVAYIERQCAAGKDGIRSPLRYLQDFISTPHMRVKLGSLVEDARLLGIPAYFVCHSEDMQQFIVVRLPWDGSPETIHRWNAATYTKFIESLIGVKQQ